MSEFHDLEYLLLESMCKACGGHGEVNDAELGDVTCNFKLCQRCKGTGFKDGKVLKLVESKDD